MAIKMAIKLSKIKECPECGSDNVLYNQKRDQLICKSCGMIFSELTPDQEKKFEKASNVI